MEERDQAPTSSPEIEKLLIAAISSDRANIVAFLLERYPLFDVNSGVIVDINFEFDTTFDSFLTKALQGTNDRVINFLLDHNADMNAAGYLGRFGALPEAILHNKLLDVVKKKKMISKGAYVNSIVVQFAVSHSRADVLRYFQTEVWPPEGDWRKEQLITEAKEVATREKIDETEKLVRRWSKLENLRDE
ncbi:MAG: hypothetical protein M1821_005047 [Bathelium mastoideum]|nr:MAG: hypothetical protein M1821_005047 [Bathelium mastoideum]